MRDIVREESERGATVFFSSHIMGAGRGGLRPRRHPPGRKDGRRRLRRGLRDSVEGGTTLRVTVDRIDDDALQAVRSLPDVSNATVQGQNPPTVVVAVDGSKTAVLSALEDRGIEIRDFETTEASLEDVFQSYTTDAGTEVHAR